MEFVTGQIDDIDVSDKEIFDLLSEVYVQAGYTASDTAKSIFEPAKVRSRGVVFVAKEVTNNELAGIVIVVPWNSPACVKAKGNECEMHLLGVSPKYRRQGLGRMLVEIATKFAKERDLKRMLLWTQKPMTEAQRLYESTGFTRSGEMERNGIQLMVYERECI